MDFDTLRNLRDAHGGWRLLLADHAPMIVSFLHGCFIESNTRAMTEGELSTRLDDHLAGIREVQGEDSFRRLDRQVRERMTWFEGGKGEVLEEVFGEHDAIADSDQGRSFRGTSLLTCYRASQ